jgi:hypothetical protein
VVSFHQVSPLKPCKHLSSIPYVLHVLAISVFLTRSPELYLARSRDYKAPCYVVFSTSLLPCPSQKEISCSTHYSRKPSDYIPPSMCAKISYNITEDTFKILIRISERNGSLKRPWRRRDGSRLGAFYSFPDYSSFSARTFAGQSSDSCGTRGHNVLKQLQSFQGPEVEYRSPLRHST